MAYLDAVHPLLVLLHQGECYALRTLRVRVQDEPNVPGFH